MTDILNLTLPTGRLVQGSLYEPSTTDMQGQPLVVKNGPNAGQPLANYWFKVAIPKGAEQHWAQTEWGAKIYAVGNTAFPAVAASPQFAWKIEDGDSQIPDINRQGRKNCETEGFPGHWILKFSRPQAPRIVRNDPQQNKWVDELQAGFVKCGYYVQVNVDVVGNGVATKPGIYLNHRMVAFIGYGPEIQFGPDPQKAGFTATMPAGASAVPVASAPLPAVAPAPSPIPVVPNVQFVHLPPPPPPAPPARRMTPAANGVTYEAYRAANWTDEMLIQQGLMLP